MFDGELIGEGSVMLTAAVQVARAETWASWALLPGNERPFVNSSFVFSSLHIAQCRARLWILGTPPLERGFSSARFFFCFFLAWARTESLPKVPSAIIIANHVKVLDIHAA